MPVESSCPIPMSAAILAAGSARRMQREKLLLELGGQSLVRRVAIEVVAIGLPEIFVVVNAHNQAAVVEELSGLPVRVLVNPRAADGMGTSIALAASSVAAASQGLLLLQGDQPFVDRQMLLRFVSEWRDASPSFVAACYAGVTTTPVLFGQPLLRELRALDGDRGARPILLQHAGSGREIAFSEWQGFDVDTEADYARARDLWAARRP